MICILDDKNIIVNILNTDTITAPNQKPFYPWNTLWTTYTDKEPVEYARERYITMAGAEFARRRDKTRFIDINGHSCGFECTNRAITNFMAAKDALKDKLEAWNGEGAEPTIDYKVLDENGGKWGVKLTMAQMREIQETVRAEQWEEYLWYNDLKDKLEKATSTESLESIYILSGGELTK